MTRSSGYGGGLTFSLSNQYALMVTSVVVSVEVYKEYRLWRGNASCSSIVCGRPGGRIYVYKVYKVYQVRWYTARAR
jgi:hypothetical protein